jgi:hypothetical protein
MFNARRRVYGHYLICVHFERKTTMPKLLNESTSDDILFVCLFYGNFLLNDGLLHHFFFPFIAYQTSLLSLFHTRN